MLVRHHLRGVNEVNAAVAIANEIKSNHGHDFSLADAYCPEYLATKADAEGCESERQRINAAMAEWYGIG